MKSALYYIRCILYARSLSEFKRWVNLVPEWKRSLAFKPMFSKTANLTFEAIAQIESHVQPEHRVFQYGSDSIFLFIERGCEVHAVEHSPKKWHALCERYKNYPKFTGHFAMPRPIGNPAAVFINAGNPWHYASKSPEFTGQNFQAYAALIDVFPDNHFDVVLVDGRARTSCIAHAMPKVKPGGLLVIDNAEREYYVEAFQEAFSNEYETVLNSHGPMPYTAAFTTTLILRRK